ncbi:hypothetical protein RJ641_018045, partial [Dillenia turbinata]
KKHGLSGASTHCAIQALGLTIALYINVVPGISIGSNVARDHLSELLWQISSAGIGERLMFSKDVRFVSLSLSSTIKESGDVKDTFVVKHNYLEEQRKHLIRGLTMRDQENSKDHRLVAIDRVFFNSTALSVALLMALILAASSLANDSCNALKIWLFRYRGNKASRICTGSCSNCKIGENSSVFVLTTSLSTVNFPSLVVNLKNSSSAASTHTPFTSQISPFGDRGSKSSTFKEPIDWDIRPTKKIRVTLFANTDDSIFKTKFPQFCHPGFGFFDDCIVESTTKASITRHNNQSNFLDRSSFGKRNIYVFSLELLINIVKHFHKSLRKRSSINNSLLSSSHFCSGHKLHCFSDLLGVLH